MRKFLLLLPILFLVSCAADSYGARVWSALRDRAPEVPKKIAEDPSLPGVGIAVWEWIAGSLAAAAATGGTAVVAVKKTRKRRAAKKLASLSAPVPTVVDPPLNLPPA